MKHNKYSKLKIPKCPVCGEEMELDDIDYISEGNQNNYFICETDNTDCYQEVRYSKVRYSKVSFEEVDKE